MKPNRREENCNEKKPTTKQLWHFNLRRINSNRAEILDLHKLAAATTNTSDKLKHLNEYLDCKSIKSIHSDQGTEAPLDQSSLLNVEIKEKDDDESETFQKQIDLNNLIKNIEFDVQYSLIDQINSFRNNDAPDLDSISVESPLSTTETEAATFSESKCNNNNVSHRNVNSPCIHERLSILGASCVSNDCFQHVTAQFKHSTKYASFNNSAQTQSVYKKCELVYEDKFYWLVKIKRYSNSLFQMRLVKNSSITHSTSLIDLAAVASSEVKHDLTAPSSPTHAMSSSFSSSSLSTSFERSAQRSSFKKDKFASDNFSYFFSIDSFEENLKSATFSSRICHSLRPIGWSKRHGRFMQKPTASQLRHFVDESREEGHEALKFEDDLFEFVSSLCKQSSMNEQYKQGRFCEIEDEADSSSVSIVEIVRNVAGRLLIRFLDHTKCWIFYLDSRLHQLGWAKQNNYEYNNPAHESCPMQAMQSPDKENLNNDDAVDVNQHELRNEQRLSHLKLNYLCECLYRNKFYVARVTQVLEDVYFKVELDTDHFLGKKVLKFYFNNSNNNNNLHALFPCKWCCKNNQVLQRPSGWPQHQEFDWDIYVKSLDQTGIVACLSNDLALFNWSRNLSQLCEKFQLGMFLECVDYDNEEHSVVRLGQIKAKLAHLIYVKIIENNRNQEENLRVFSVDSMDLYPVGWCEMNNYYENTENHFKYYRYPYDFLDEATSKQIESLLNESTIVKIPYLSHLTSKF